MLWRRDKRARQRKEFVFIQSSAFSKVRLPMSLLLFPDEVLLDIFDYLSFTELIRTFYEIMSQNQRIQQLISQRLRSVYLSEVDLRDMTKSQFLFLGRFIRSKDEFCERIRFLTLSNRYTFGEIRLFLSLIPFDRLSNLKCLTLIEPTLDEYRILFPNIVSSLTHLILEYPESDEEDRVVLIDEMPELIELTIRSNGSVQFRSQYDRLEKLVVSRVNLIDLIGFSTFFPNLHYLDLTILGAQMDYNQIKIPLLTVLKLRSEDVEHESCEKFIRQFPQLRELFYSNHIDCAENSLVDGQVMERLLQSLPLLEVFGIDLHLYEAQKTDICQLVATFQTPFFLSKHWNIVCECKPNARDFHVYSLPISDLPKLEISTESLVSSAVVPIDDPFSDVTHLRINMTSNWPLVTRFFSNVQTLELFQSNSSSVIPSLSILSYLNKSMFLSKLRKLILLHPCRFEDVLLRHLLQQSATSIEYLDVPCQYFLRLIKTNVLQAPLPVRFLILRHDYLPAEDVEVFLEFFQNSLKGLSLYLPNNESITEILELFLDRFVLLYSLNIHFNDSLSMLGHVEICKVIQRRPQVGAELRPTNIRIWQK